MVASLPVNDLEPGRIPVLHWMTVSETADTVCSESRILQILQPIRPWRFRKPERVE